MDEKDAKKDLNDVDVTDVTPQLVITHQGHVAEEHFSQNGITKEVHVVVKNLVFLIEAVSNIDLNQPKCNVEAKLLYDYDKEEDSKVEVSFVKNEPMEYKVTVSENGYKATVELRIKVLTSQHEDMLFRVRLQAIDPMTQMSFIATSQPIKVISKLTQLKKKELNTSSTSVAQVNKKRITNDQISNSLGTLTQQLQRQQKCIEMILQKLHLEAPPQISSLSSSSESLPLEALSIVSNAITSAEQSLLERGGVVGGELFDVAFQNFVTAFRTLPLEEKKIRLHQLLDTLPSENLTEMFDVFDSSPARKRYRNN